MNNNLGLDDFPANCGIGVLTGFNPSYDYQTEKYLEGEDALTGEDIERNLSYAKANSNGMVMATYNEDQLKVIPSLPDKLKKAGFQELVTFTNPNSDNRVWVYWKMLVRPFKPRTRRSTALSRARGRR